MGRGRFSKGIGSLCASILIMLFSVFQLSAETVTFTYDSLNRLNSAIYTESDSEIHYSYDSNGNLLRVYSNIQVRITLNPTGAVPSGQIANVTSDVGNLNCTWDGTSKTGTCESDAITGGTSVILAASLPPGTSIAWGDGCDSNTVNTCTINLTADKTISPITSVESHTLSVNPSGTVTTGQTVTITSYTGSLNCTWNGASKGGQCSTTALIYGTPITLLAALPSGTSINWGTGCDSNTSDTCTINSLVEDKALSPITSDGNSPNAPVVSGTTPTNNPQPEWTWVSGGGDGNGLYQCKLDNGTWAGCTSPYTPVSVLNEGPHILYVQERDDAGNWSASGSKEIIVDTIPPVGGESREVPKTGQTKCYISGAESDCLNTGQDGEIQAGVAWPDPRFSENTDGTITDNLTGFIWTKDAGTPNAGSCVGGAKTWQEALNYVKCLNNIYYLGHNDWRLPNIKELLTILNLQQPNPGVWLMEQGFSNVQSIYWTSTTHARYTERAWFVAVIEGSQWFSEKSDSYFYAWVVRSEEEGILGDPPVSVFKTGQTKCYDSSGLEAECLNTGQDGELQKGKSTTSRYTDNGYETVTDELTGLMWTKDANCPGPPVCSPGIWKTWPEALDHINCLNSSNYLGHNDWRLPNLNEIRSLQDYSNAFPSLQSGNPFVNVQTMWYWSSTTCARYTGNAWTLEMGAGWELRQMKNDVDFLFPAWPVRFAEDTVIIDSGASFTNSTMPDVAVKCFDSGTGCAEMQFSSDNLTWATPQEYIPHTNIDLTAEDGTKTVYVKFKDNAGSWSKVFSDSITLDTTSPLTSATLVGGAYNETQSVTLSCTDGAGSGCNKTFYCLGTDCVPSIEYNGGNIDISGSTDLRFYSTDNAGNDEEIKTEAYIIDTSFAYYCDKDGDNHFNSASDGSCSDSNCLPQGCQTTPGDDCNDDDANEHPDQTWYKDADSDGYSDGTTNTTSCTRPTGYKATSELTATSGDCNESDATIHPAATELCDNKDNDCNSNTPDGSGEAWYNTITNCGVGVCSNTGHYICTNGVKVSNCVIGNPTGSDSDCNGIDENCDGVIDNNYVPVSINCGVGECASTGQLICNSGHISNTCMPNSPAEIAETSCSDGLDNDCDGKTDCADTDCGSACSGLPLLSIQQKIPAMLGDTVQVPVVFHGNGNDISSIVFSLNFEQVCLSFDPADIDEDGIPDAITFNLPASFSSTATFNGSDTDGEIDFLIADYSLPLGTFSDGALAYVGFKVLCEPASETTIIAPIQFSANPSASFGNTSGQSVAGLTADGSIEIWQIPRGDCNGDKKVDAGDISATVLEIFDGDGNLPKDSPGGTFIGCAEGCDANNDGIIDAGDISCIVLIIFNGPGACGN